MDSNTKIIVVILILMVILCVGIIIVFDRYIKNNIIDGPGSVDENAETAESDGIIENTEYSIYHPENVLDLTSWLGKTVQEAEIDEKYLQLDNGYHRISFEGKLFGKAAHGDVSLSLNDYKTMDMIYVFTSELNYDEAKEKFTELYGEPSYETEEPYVESNGGAVLHCEFKNDDVRVKLSSASNYDYISIGIQK